jgi:hypothetical protein
LRALAGATGLPLAGLFDFDFAATFFVFEAALAMAFNYRKREINGRHTPRFGDLTQAE